MSKHMKRSFYYERQSQSHRRTGIYHQTRKRDNTMEPHTVETLALRYPEETLILLSQIINQKKDKRQDVLDELARLADQSETASIEHEMLVKAYEIVEGTDDGLFASLCQFLKTVAVGVVEVLEEVRQIAATPGRRQPS